MDDRAERFRGIFETHYEAVVAYARRRAAAADVDDVVAETFTTAWRRLEEIPTDVQLPWLYGVARRVLANQRRGADRRRRLLAKLAVQPADSADHELPASDDTVRMAVDRLRPHDQEVLRLAAWEGLGAGDIAIVLDCSPNAAALRLSRARRRLRAELTEARLRRTSTQRKVTDV